MNIYISRLDNLKLLKKTPQSVIPEGINGFEGYIGKINNLELKYKDAINKRLEKSIQLSINQRNILLSKPVFTFIYESGENEYKLNSKLKMDNYYGHQHLQLQDLIGAFTIALWLIKDNAVNFNNSYHFNIFNSYESTIHMDIINTTSSGIITNTTFDDDEIKAAINLMYIVNEMLTKQVDKINIKRHDNEGTIYWSREEFNSHEFMKDDTYNCARVLLYLQEARSTGSLTTKISKYCACLECIFAIKENHTKNITEITSKLVGKNLEEQENIYLNMKEAYSIRSDQEHGGQIKFYKNHTKKDIISLSKCVDYYVREAIRYLIENPGLKYRMGNIEEKSRTRKHFKEIARKG